MEKTLIAHKTETRDGKIQIQSLEEHLFNTAKYCRKIGKDINLPWTCYLIGLSHDLGKAFSNFQEYINNETKDKVNHSSIGGIFLINYFTSLNKGCEGKLVGEILSYTIFAHHGLFDLIESSKENMGFNRRINFNEDEKYKESQIKEFIYNNIEKKLLQEEKINLIELVYKAFEEMEEMIDKIYIMSNKKLTRYDYYIHLLTRLLLSILKEGDIYDSSNAFRNNKDGILTEEDYDELWNKGTSNIEEKYSSFKSEKNTSKLNQARTNLANQAKENAIKIERGIFKAELPTGSGKTLLTTRFALNNCKEFKKKRFFYITAFLSVLEQNAKEIKDIINSELVLEHHSNIVIPEDDEYRKDCGNNQLFYSRQYMMDSWESPVILTTMVQFMNTLFKGKASNIRRFCKLINSVIVLDEVQSIPISTISNFNLVNNFLSEIMNTTIIHCTATQPELDSNYLKYSTDYSNINNGYLAKLEKEEEKVFKRTKAFYISKENGYCSEEISEEIKLKAKENSSILIICNTKKVVNEIYEQVKSLEDEKFSVYQLTTNQCAAHRLRKIDEIREKLDKNEKIIVVSSQLIEAGVDVDFQVVYRSLSGIPSLIQAMGRCNREGKLDYGNFYIFDLESENTKMLQDIHEQKKHSRKILEKYKNEEVDIDVLKREYYNYLYANSDKLDYSISDGSLIEILSTNKIKRVEYRQSHGKKYNYYLGQNFKLASNSFKMIEDNGYSVIVSLDEGFGDLHDENKEYLSNYKEAIENYDFYNAKIALKKLQPFTINIINIEEYQLYVEKIGDILVLMSYYYDKDIGLKAKELETIIY